MAGPFPAGAASAAAIGGRPVHPGLPPPGGIDGSTGIWLRDIRIAFLVLWPVIALATIRGIHHENQWIYAYLYLWTCALVVAGAMVRRCWPGFRVTVIADGAVIVAGSALVAMAVALDDCGCGGSPVPSPVTGGRPGECHGPLPVVGSADPEVFRRLEELVPVVYAPPSVEHGSKRTCR
ncbi:MAG: hypothetical protein L6R48_18650 [Planctomycetes bacterium]|nr:hypothetical protein [Planctomycetota bacterium]